MPKVPPSPPPAPPEYPTLLRAAQIIHCAEDGAQIQAVLRTLSRSTDPLLGLPPEDLTRKTPPALRAATLDLVLHALHAAIGRFPALRGDIESLVLSWNYCAINYQNRQWDLFFHDGTVTAHAAAEPMTVGREGFRRWGFLDADPTDRYVPTLLLDQNRLPEHWAAFRHIITVTRCFPEPRSGHTLFDPTTDGPFGYLPNPLLVDEKQASLPPLPNWPPQCPLEGAVVATPQPAPAPMAAAPPPQPVPMAAPGGGCQNPKPLTEGDLAIAHVAWRFFENNYQPDTGLVNAADNYPSTTMWDIASSLAATVIARELSFLQKDPFDQRIAALLKTLSTQRLYRDEAPNKAYNCKLGTMSDYGNNPTEGIGYSALDLARLMSWLSALSCLNPQHVAGSQRVLGRWNYCRMVRDGQMYGAAVDEKKQDSSVQEGRLGYEQYAGKAFALLGFDVKPATTYRNSFATRTDILGVPIAYDRRDAATLGAHNYVVTESYAMDAVEHGLDSENLPLMENIFKVQKLRWQKTGQVTAVSEDNIDRPPYFLYNSIFVDGKSWQTITDTGQDHQELRTVSVKAAFSLAYLFPNDPYAAVLLDTVKDARDPDRGYYSGVYEDKKLGFNKSITANTNSVILELMLNKMYGAIHRLCANCKRQLRFSPDQLRSPEARKLCRPR